jgi:hypothetical protein
MTTQVSITIPQFVADALAAVLPKAYTEWWVRLMHDNPTHLYIETTLVSCLRFDMWTSAKPASTVHGFS